MLTETQNPDVSLKAKVDFLSVPASYGGGNVSVETRETHMSWVFLTDRYAYKLKKPVRTSFLDFSTLELRRKYCEAEVRLNWDLAPGVYLGVVALGLDRSRGLQIGEGEPVDYLVQMIRLPAWNTLENGIRLNNVTEQQVRTLALRLAEFYRKASVIKCSAEAYSRRLSAEIDADALALSEPRHGMPLGLVTTAANKLRGFISSQRGHLDRRIDEQRIVDGHGDLRPEHIYFLSDRIVVIDRLEFNDTFREIDPLDEFAYLAMECDRSGMPRFGPWLFETYAAETGDEPPADLLAFYKGTRALLRAKLAIWHVEEPGARTGEQWRAQAKAYLDLASEYAALM
jgi:aminoglycoside phosphotransferase family enzyme